MTGNQGYVACLQIVMGINIFAVVFRLFRGLRSWISSRSYAFKKNSSIGIIPGFVFYASKGYGCDWCDVVGGEGIDW